jgi:hypothetical protein
MRKPFFWLLSFLSVSALSSPWARVHAEPVNLQKVGVLVIQNPSHDYAVTILSESIDEPERSHGVPPGQSLVQYFKGGKKLWEKSMSGNIDVKNINFQTGDLIVAQDFDLNGRQGFTEKGEPLQLGRPYGDFFNMVESRNGRYLFYASERKLVLFDLKNNIRSKFGIRKNIGLVTDDGKRILSDNSILDEHLAKVAELPPNLRFLAISDNDQAFVTMEEKTKNILMFDKETGKKLFETPLPFLKTQGSRGSVYISSAVSVKNGRLLMLLMEKSKKGPGGVFELTKRELVLVNLEGDLLWRSPEPLKGQREFQYQLVSLDHQTVVLQKKTTSCTSVKNQKAGYPSNYIDTKCVTSFENTFYAIEDQP